MLTGSFRKTEAQIDEASYHAS